MMRVTGNKPGNIPIDTARVVLVPAGSFERGIEQEYLRFNGMALSAGEKAVASDERAEIVAIMAVSAAEWNSCEEECKRGEVSMTSPLLDVATGRDPKHSGRNVDILLTAENVYIAVWEKGLRMAEAMPDNSIDSVLYYMQAIGRQFKLRKFDINVSGPGVDAVADALKQYYGHVKTGASK